jgi:molecular chaperone DnaJ
VVETPVRLSDAQKDLLRQLEESMTKDSARHSPRAKSFMEKVREFFAG